MALLLLAQQAGSDAAEPGTADVSEVRLVRHFDFEEAELVPHEMPLNFYRYGAEEGGFAQGFPPFGSMRLTNEIAYSGNWSFQFDLDGGSLAARVPNAVIPVVPLADYVVTARVRTDSLRHARARLVAWLYDRQGEIIPASISRSPLVQTAGEWQTLSVEVPGRFEEAADLGLELQLLQPRQFRVSPEDPDVPILEDVRGRAWFDDVSVWHLPRIELRTTQPGQVIMAPDVPTLNVLIRDLAHHDLAARLRVFDIDGGLVFDQRFLAPRAPRPRRINIPLTSFGWYRAVLDVESDGELSMRRHVDFVYLPPVRRSQSGWRNTFHLALGQDWPRDDTVIPELAAGLRVGTVILPIWQRSGADVSARDAYENIRPTIEALRSQQHELIFSLERVPEPVRHRFDLGEDEVLVALDRDPGLWREYLEDLIVNFGFEVPQWQIGRTGSSNTWWQVNAADLLRRVRQLLERSVPGASLFVPIVAEQRVDDSLDLATYNIYLPREIRPSAIGRYAAIWREADVGPIVTIEAAADDLYSERQQVQDLVLRVLHTWREGLTRLAMMPPWSRGTGRDAPIMPTAQYAAWRQLVDHLDRREVVGELSVGPGRHCWILRGVSANDAALVAWREPGADPEPFRFQLAEHDVEVVDVFGNSRTVHLRGDRHAIELDELPIFVEGINLELVQFRSGFSIDPPFIPVEARVHEHDLLIPNPWDMPISGTLRIAETDRLHITPRVHEFSIRPRDTVRLPVQIVVDRSILAGRVSINADVSLTADAQYQLQMAADVQLGLEHLDFSATWRVVRNVETGRDDLVITQYITNTGDRQVNVEGFIIGPAIRQQRRVVAGLAPGEMAIRMFTIPDGVELISGRSLRIGILERDSVARLNQVIEIPALVERDGPD